MSKYRIGCFEGEWTNFTPPIQGGTFRKETKELSVDPKALSQSKPAPLLSETSQLDVVPGSYTAGAIQEAVDADIAKYPSLDAATQHNITLKFRELHQRVRDEGYYDCRYVEYAKEMARYTTLFCLFLYFLRKEWYATSASFLGLWWHQIMFTAHDAGHRGITHNFVIDSLIGIFIGNFCSGLSIGWWKSSHNVHHFVTNDPVCCIISSQGEMKTNVDNRFTILTSKTRHYLQPRQLSSPPSSHPTTTASNSSGMPLLML